MGMSVSGMLVYGIDLGREGCWATRSADAIRRTYKTITGESLEPYREEGKILLVRYGSIDYPGYILAARRVRAWYEFEPEDVPDLAAFDCEAMDKQIHAAAEVLDIEILEEPRWLLTVDYSH